jgi:hypothetical protein
VRRHGDVGLEEWYFELDDRAMQRGARPHAVSRAADPAGLPAPNAATVELWGFRGVRTIQGRPRAEWTAEEAAEVELVTQEAPLIYAGHIGVSVDGGKTIFGLTPSNPDQLPVREFLRTLMAHEAYPAVLGKDTDVFRLAAKYADEGWNTRPVSVVELVDKPQKLEIAAKVAEMSGMEPGEHGLGYSFPLDRPEAGQHYAASNGFAADCIRNCATFPAKIGVPIPEPSGDLKQYMPQLEKWSSEDGPKDFRTKEGTK